MYGRMYECMDVWINEWMDVYVAVEQGTEDQRTGHMGSIHIRVA